MDIYESHSILQKSLKNSIQLFDLLFEEISVINSQSHAYSQSSSSDELSYRENISISCHILTPSQRESIKCLSGHLLTLQKVANDVNYLLKCNITSDIQERIEYLEKVVSERDATERKDIIKIRTLQDFLVNELTRNQELEQRIQDLEVQLVTIEDDKRNYMKKLSSLTGLKAEKAIAIDELVGQHVMKKFEEERYFGLIVGYNHPYFQIVYDDDDKEEMEQREVEQYLWKGTIPTVKLSRIQHYAEAYLADSGLTIQLQSQKSPSSTSYQSNNNDNDNNSIVERKEVLSLTKIIFPNQIIPNSSSSSSNNNLMSGNKRKEIDEQYSSYKLTGYNYEIIETTSLDTNSDRSHEDFTKVNFINNSNSGNSSNNNSNKMMMKKKKTINCVEESDCEIQSLSTNGDVLEITFSDERTETFSEKSIEKR